MKLPNFFLNSIVNLWFMTNVVIISCYKFYGYLEVFMKIQVFCGVTFLTGIL